MAACGSLQHIYEKTLLETPTLLQSLSPWKHLKSIEDTSPSCTEFFGELHFKENTPHHSSISSSSSSFPIDFSPPVGNVNREDKKTYVPSTHRKHYNRNSENFSSMNSESLSLCTEGLGFESCEDLEDTASSNEWEQREGKTRSSYMISRHRLTNDDYLSGKRSRITGGEFPPPISCIGSSGKPWVCFKSFRHDGRFILKEVRIPTLEFLHACREDGRLKLHFIQSDDDDDDDDHDHDDDDDESTIEEGEDEGQDDDNDDDDCSHECAQSFAHDECDLGEENNDGERIVEEDDDGRGQIFIGN